MNHWDANLLAELTLRATALLLIAITAAWWLRRRSAVARHVVWVTAFAGLLSLPILTLTLPAWHVLPASGSHPVVESARPADEVFPPTELENRPTLEALVNEHVSSHTTVRASSAPMRLRTAVPTAAGSRSSQLPPAETLLLALWVAGCTLCLTRIMVSHLWMRHVIRRAKVVRSGPLRNALDQLTQQFGWTRNVKLVITRTGTMPMACGIRTEAILLPPDSKDWTDTQQRSVLLHEFGHILRRDPLWKLLVEIGRSVYWFHPLVWLAARQAAADRERACDDLVLRSGIPAADYARHLLDVVSGGRLRQLSAVAGVAMASTRRLDRRLRSLMDAAQDRRPPRRLSVAATLLIGTSLLVPIAVVRSSEVRQSDDQPGEQQRPTNDAGNPAPSEVWEVRLQAVDERTGAPIPNPRFIVQLSGDRWTEHAGNENGEFIAKFATRAPRYCYLKVRADGYAAMQGFWSNRDNEPRDELPEEVVFEMEASITVGGVVVDEEGNPVEGATVYFSAGHDVWNEGRRIQQYFHSDPCVTDAEGRWQCHMVPPGVDDASFRVEHADFVNPDSNLNRNLDDYIPELKEQTHRWELKRGFVIRGRVVDTNGLPVEGAVLALAELNAIRFGGPFPRTNAEGRFTFPRVASMHGDRIPNEALEMTVTAIKPGFAPVKEMIPGFGGLELGSSTEESRIVNITLQSGLEIAFRFRDVDGNAVSDVRVRTDKWNGIEPLSALQESGIPRDADPEGKWNWDWAPDGKIKYRFEAPGFRDQDLWISADGLSHEVILEREQVITGHVVDADTGEPIPLFYIEPGYARNQSDLEDTVTWMPTRRTRGGDGEYFVRVNSTRDTLHYRALAEGYEPAESGAVTVEEGEVTLDFELHRREAEEESADTSQIDMGAVNVTLLAQAQGCLTRRFLILEALARQERAAGRQLASTPLESSLQAAAAR